jgi:membrane-bound serine protease (ClpP class)
MLCLFAAIRGHEPGSRAKRPAGGGEHDPERGAYSGVENLPGAGNEQAVNQDAELIVIQLNTPGGSVTLMNELVQQILASPVPVAVFVAPEGALAASAGTLLVLAGDIAAMSPGSAIGAASPVGLQGEEIETTEALKTKEILKASVRSMAEWRGQEAVTLAEEAIDDARAASAQEALVANLVDYLARDLDDLLEQLDGQEVMMDGQEIQLNTAGARIETVQAKFIEKLLGMLTDPNIVFILLSLGVQAVLIELSSPGGWVAGFFGAIMLVLAIYGLGILPVNLFGLVFMVIALVLFILDIKAPTHGALTAAGTGSFIAGALILFNSSRVPFYTNVSVPWWWAWASFWVPPFRGGDDRGESHEDPHPYRKGIAGRAYGNGRDRDQPERIAQVAGEQWSAKLAEGAEAVKAGERVEVVGTEG